MKSESTMFFDFTDELSTLALPDLDNVKGLVPVFDITSNVYIG